MDKNCLLAIKLAKAETEQEIISILREHHYWDESSNWSYFGHVENNYSTIGNQQGAPDSALVEKLVNSIDSILMKNCLLRDIDPEGRQAPRSIKQALIDFFSIREGDIANLDTKTRNTMSREIILSATGSKSHPNYVIADMGEGQNPLNMPNTILSIGKSNKLKIPFVQGKFNMGGTGVFRFCSPDYNMQIIISKRCPDIKLHSDGSSSKKWGFTVIRREAASDGRKSSTYTYLTNSDGGIMSFDADGLEILPKSNNSFDIMHYGMFIKMIDYNIGPYRTALTLDLNYRLALLMPKMAYPIRLIECRDYKAHSLEATLSGLDVRLKDDNKSKIESGFPNSFQFRSLEQEFSGLIYVFKEDADISNYKKGEGVLFTINGQTHASLPLSFFRRKRSDIGLSYLADSLLVIVDCSKLGIKQREDLFMNSRDRLCECPLEKEIEKSISDLLRNHEGLRVLQSLRRQKALSDRLSDEKPLANVLSNILSKSPTLAKLFLAGESLKIPYNIKDTGIANEYIGKKHPSFFKLKHRIKNDVPYKMAPINHDYRIQFITDVDNDYFSRDTEPGDIEIFYNGILNNSLKKHLGLFNGVATLTLIFPMDVKVDDLLNFEVRILDEYVSTDLSEIFTVQVAKEQNYGNSGQNGKRTPPSGLDQKGKVTQPNGLALPNTLLFYHGDWAKYKANQETALVVNGGNESGYDFCINMENICLLNELKNVKNEEKASLIKAQYKYCNVLVGMSVLNYYNNEDGDDDIDVEERVKTISTMLAPIMLPMINVLGELDSTDLEVGVPETV